MTAKKRKRDKIQSRWELRSDDSNVWNKGPEWRGPLINPNLRVDPRYKDVNIHVFDDVDNCPAAHFNMTGLTTRQKNRKVYYKHTELFGWIGQAMAKMGYDGNLIFHLAGTSDVITPSHGHAFKKMGIGSFTTVKTGVPNAADIWLLKQLAKWFEGKKDQLKICIILSGDKKAFWDPLEDPRYEYVDIHVFDDIDNFPAAQIQLKGLPTEQKNRKVYHKHRKLFGWIGRAMANIGYKGNRIFHVAGTLDGLTKSHVYAFEKMGIGVKNAADIWLLKQLTKWFEEGEKEGGKGELKICIILFEEKAFWDALEEIYNTPNCKCFLAIWLAEGQKLFSTGWPCGEAS